MTTVSDKDTRKEITIGVLALQGAFEEHQRMMEKGTGCKTVQIRTPSQLKDIDGIILPGGESTAMGLIGSSTVGMWAALKDFILHSKKPTWGTCAGMILLAERCVGASAVIENGQSFIGGVDVIVCRNYFGSQISSFEMKTPPPPGFETLVSEYNTQNDSTTNSSNKSEKVPFPGVFIRAPAILSSLDSDLQILGKVHAPPCRQAAVVLDELDKKIKAGENVMVMGVVDALERSSNNGIHYKNIKISEGETKNYTFVPDDDNIQIELPGASDKTNAREVICAARKNNILITAFHPEVTNDYRWHQYFHKMSLECRNQS